MINGYKTFVQGEYVGEPIGHGKYIILKENSKPEVVEVTQSKKGTPYFIRLGTNTHEIEPILTRCIWRVPKDEDIEEFCNGKFKDITWSDCVIALLNSYRTLIDFRNDEDVYALVLFTLQTYMKDFLEAVFFYSLDSTTNTGKTMIAENIAYHSYRTLVRKDVSISAIFRSVEKYGVNILIDEIDALHREKKSECESMFRGGYRRGTPVSRVEKVEGKFISKDYDLFGCHGFTYRGTVADDLKNRSISNQMMKSVDHRRPLLNFFKGYQSYQPQTLLFFSRLKNYHQSLKRFSKFGSQVTEVTAKSNYTQELLPNEIEALIQKRYDTYIEHFTPEAKDYMKTLFGRNMELFFVMYNISRVSDVALMEHIEKIFNKKKDEDNLGDDTYLEIYKDFLTKKFNELKEGIGIYAKFKIKKGKHEGFFKYPQTQLDKEFMTELKASSYPMISMNRKKQILRDLGFVSLDNMGVNHKIDGTTTKCVVFTKKIQKELGVWR